LNNATTQQKERNDLSGFRVTILSMVINVVLAIAKLIGGMLFNSTVLLADAGHSLTDLVSDFVTYISLKLGRQPSDAEHPYGHGKFETLGTVVIAIILLSSGVFLAKESVAAIIDPRIPEFSAVYVALFSIGVKEALYHITKRIALRINSSVLEANAWHHRSDALSSIAALLGILAAVNGYPVFDGIAALIVSIFIGGVGIKLGYKALEELLETALDPEINQRLRKVCLEINDLIDIHDLRTRRMGSQILVDLHIRVPAHISVSHGHQIAERARMRIMEAEPQIADALVHVDTEDNSSYEDHDFEFNENIERDVRKLKFEGVTHISRVVSHFFNNKMSVHLQIKVAGDLSVNDAEKIAETVCGQINQLESVSQSKVFLDLN
jgi:cation diffusion facilitator family transporter